MLFNFNVKSCYKILVKLIMTAPIGANETAVGCLSSFHRIDRILGGRSLTIHS